MKKKSDVKRLNDREDKARNARTNKRTKTRQMSLMLHGKERRKRRGAVEGKKKGEGDDREMKFGTSEIRRDQVEGKLKGKKYNKKQLR